MYKIAFHDISSNSNIIYINEDHQIIDKPTFYDEIQSEYKAGIIGAPFNDGITMFVAMPTPYKKEQHVIDRQYLIHNYEEFCKLTGKQNMLADDPTEYFVSEIA